jgi:four helix bundle protein
MNHPTISIQERTQNFAIRVVNAYTEINKANHFNDAAVILAKQFLRSGTSIGANCSEAKFAQSTKDFLSKYSIALKEAHETKYWIEIMIKSNVVAESKFELILDEVEIIIKILISTTKKLKDKC